MSTRTLRDRWTLVLLALTATGIAAGTAHATFPGRDGAIAFSRYLFYDDVCGGQSSYRILTVLASGRRGPALGPEAWGADSPAFSPDGTKLAVEYDDTLSVIRLAGGRPRTVFSADLVPTDPAWSPSGDRLVFAGYIENPAGPDLPGFDGIASIRLDGTGVRELAQGGSEPDWSSRGQIVYSGRFSRLEIVDGHG